MFRRCVRLLHADTAQPCQSLFVAPCSHVWHYKCIRPILNGPTWPNFLCPNCRAVGDLEADVEDPGEFEQWDNEAEIGLEEPESAASSHERQLTPRASAVPLVNSPPISNESSLAELAAALSSYNIADSLNGIASQPVPGTVDPNDFITVIQPVTIRMNAREGSGRSPNFPSTANHLGADRPTDCPMTPRNNAGPFVLDGDAGRGSDS